MFYLKFIIPIFFIISSTEVFASCFSFLPYAFNGEYVHLPKDLEFCYKKLDGEVFIKTNKDGGRLINYKKTTAKKRILAFGDSQLLGIDFLQTNRNDQHDLEIIFPDYFIEIYAAPNNGPHQSLIHIDEIRKSIINKNDQIVVGFNYGTDIFRVLSEWNVENFVPLNTIGLKTVLKNPYIYDLIILKGIMEGKFFSIKKDVNESNRNQYINIKKYKLDKHLSIWTKKLSLVLSELDNPKTLIIYPPYWGFEKSGIKLTDGISKDYYKFICRKDLHKIFTKILFAETDSAITLTGDKRHFKTSSLKYLDANDVCL